MNEAAKILPKIEKYLQPGQLIVDLACGDHKVVPHAVGVDGRSLPSVDLVVNMEDPEDLYRALKNRFAHFLHTVDVVFSSHYLEHCPDQYRTIQTWHTILKLGGLLILYLPDGRFYNNKENPEHCIDMNHDQFMFWFTRSWCGEGKNFKGENFPAFFEVVDHGMDVGENRYSFYVVAKKV